jgi:hypothetical protein
MSIDVLVELADGGCQAADPAGQISAIRRLWLGRGLQHDGAVPLCVARNPCSRRTLIAVR